MSQANNILRDLSDNPPKRGVERIVAAVIGTSLTYKDYAKEKHKSDSYIKNMERIFRIVLREQKANIVCMPEYLISVELYIILQNFVESHKKTLPGGVVVFGTDIIAGYNVCPVMIYDRNSSATFFQYKNYFSPKEEEIRKEKGQGLSDYMKYTGCGELKILRTLVGNVAASICYDMYSIESKDRLVGGLHALCVPSFNEGPGFVTNLEQYIESKKCILLYANGFSGPNCINEKLVSRIFDPFNRYCEEEEEDREDLGIIDEQFVYASEGKSKIYFSVDILSFPMSLLETIKKIPSQRHL